MGLLLRSYPVKDHERKNREPKDLAADHLRYVDHASAPSTLMLSLLRATRYWFELSPTERGYRLFSLARRILFVVL